jgi:hypothetical protein
MTRRPSRILLALTIGVALTAAAAVGAFLLSSRGADHAAEALFWPNTLLQSFMPAPNIGTPDHPIHEGSPFNLLAFFASFPLAIMLYGFVAYVFLRRQKT